MYKSDIAEDLKTKIDNEMSNLVNNTNLISLEQRVTNIKNYDDYKEVIPKKLDAYLREVTNIEFITFAYEPEYAVCSGMLPNIEKIREVTLFISDYLESKYHRKPNLLYGGGVDSSNVKDIINIDSINGVLIGGISSNILEVEKIVNNVDK